MKFLHTGDLHIGKTVNGFSMLEDQKKALTQMVETPQTRGSQKHDCVSDRTANWAAPATTAPRPTIRSDCSEPSCGQRSEEPMSGQALDSEEPGAAPH